MKFLITGAAGFIGFHLVIGLISRGDYVVGVDNLNDYYDPDLKLKRLDEISNHNNSKLFNFVEMDISHRENVKSLFKENNFDVVINLAAQAGVRYSLENPNTYVDSNLIGFVNILEGCRHNEIKHFIFASSSSVYGMNKKQPFSTSDRADYPISLYAATKKSNEIIAHTYSHLFNIPTTGLRFFTVYGPYGRPDMAYYKFTKAILNGESIDVYDEGSMKRDFTYIDDIIEGIIRVISHIPSNLDNPYSNASPKFSIFNIGNNNPISLEEFIKAIENACGKTAIKNPMPIQPGDVPVTYANIDDLSDAIGFSPSTDINVGIKKFVNWYINNYHNN